MANGPFPGEEEESAAMQRGSKKASVFPVPVGETTMQSRACPQIMNTDTLTGTEAKAHSADDRYALALARRWLVHSALGKVLKYRRRNASDAVK